MALIREPDRHSYFGKSKFGGGKKLPGALDPTPDHTFVRCHAFELFERPGEMIHRQADGAGERFEADLLLEGPEPGAVS
jgi:hypothetical protein